MTHEVFRVSNSPYREWRVVNDGYPSHEHVIFRRWMLATDPPMDEITCSCGRRIRRTQELGADWPEEPPTPASSPEREGSA
jgi:hypothetical protein